jgi:hypothetical protein
MLVAASVAEARSGEPIVVVGDDAAFAAALDDALLPAGLDVLGSGSVTAPSLAELPARSRELADREHASATVWLLPSPTGATLVAYDRGVDRLLVRELPYRLPLSAPQAAEAARMVRTMLRALRVAEEDQPPPPPVVSAPNEPLLAASVGAGAWFAAPGADTALAAYAAVAWRPDALGAAVSVLAAPDASVMSATFAGQVRDIVLAAEARRALALPPSIRVTPAAGASLHLLQLRGAFGGGGTLTSRRYDPAVRLGVTATYDLARSVEAGLAVSVDYLLQRQRFVGASEEILVVPRFQVVTGIVVGLRL